MSNFRKVLIQRMIRLYGREHKIVVDFIEICKTWNNTDWNNKCLAVLVASHEKSPIFDEH